jgi:hypothetical protein
MADQEPASESSTLVGIIVSSSVDAKQWRLVDEE